MGLVGAAVPALFLGTIFWAGIKHQNKAWLSLSIGMTVAWSLVATNDWWGANQEPYRFWIDSFILATAVSFPVLAQVLVSVADIRRSQPLAEASMRSRLLAKAAGITVWGVVAWSLLDYVGFAVFIHKQGTATFDDPQARAISKTAESLPDGGPGLVLSDPCIDPFRLKALSGAPTAYYNFGLAWPTNETPIRALLEERDSGRLDQRLAERAGVEYVMVDTGCEANWQDTIAGSKVAESSYDDGAATTAVTLWRISR